MAETPPPDQMELTRWPTEGHPQIKVWIDIPSATWWEGVRPGDTMTFTVNRVTHQVDQEVDRR